MFLVRSTFLGIEHCFYSTDKHLISLVYVYIYISTLEGELGRNSKSGQRKKCQKCGTSGRGRKRSNGLNNCAVLEEGNMFCSKVTKEKYKIRQEINCHRKN